MGGSPVLQPVSLCRQVTHVILQAQLALYGISGKQQPGQ